MENVARIKCSSDSIAISINHNLDEPLVRAISTNSLLKILPAGDFGIELIKETRRIFLYGVTCNNNEHN
jgi:hypothetical protein